MPLGPIWTYLCALMSIQRLSTSLWYPAQGLPLQGEILGMEEAPEPDSSFGPGCREAKAKPQYLASSADG